MESCLFFKSFFLLEKNDPFNVFPFTRTFFAFWEFFAEKLPVLPADFSYTWVKF